MDIIDLIGKKVKLKATGETEYGVIVNAWFDKNLNIVDCYVALYDANRNYGDKEYKPYILRYSLQSLEIIESG